MVPPASHPVVGRLCPTRPQHPHAANHHPLSVSLPLRLAYVPRLMLPLVPDRFLLDLIDAEEAVDRALSVPQSQWAGFPVVVSTAACERPPLA